MTSYKFKRFFFSVPTYLVFLCNFLFYIPNYCLINYDVYVQHLKISSYFKKIFLSIEINITKLYEELLFALFSYAYLLSFFFSMSFYLIFLVYILVIKFHTVSVMPFLPGYVSFAHAQSVGNSYMNMFFHELYKYTMKCPYSHSLSSVFL